MIVINKLHP